MKDRVEIFEVGPRDGLQNEKRDIPVADKVALVDWGVIPLGRLLLQLICYLQRRYFDQAYQV